MINDICEAKESRDKVRELISVVPRKLNIALSTVERLIAHILLMV